MSCIDTGTVRGHETIVSLIEEKKVESMPWNPHPKFGGVSLRHLVIGKDTGGRISLHQVRIHPGCSIGDHAHPGQVEIHDVLDGEGVCRLEGIEIRYAPGVMGIMPADKVHRIDAGEHGMLLLATFCPPLV
ncbi:MAG TPA: cupin domain-containing protein [Methanoregula sp.]|nr:cupin domain-containing protein [Methanoregula sp.]